MATNYPGAFDDAVTLGGPFVNAFPVVDPAKNIDALYRNNLNDSVLAMQARLGITDSAVTTSLDWATLSVAGSPNQGLRFAGEHAQWPGAIAEDGLFIATGTGNVSFHKGGDPVATFTDLTAGAFATWDSIYAVDKDLAINAGTLTWTLTSPDDFVIDDGTVEYLRTDSSAAQIIIGDTAATGAAVIIEGKLAGSLTFNGAGAYDISNPSNVLNLSTTGAFDLTFAARGSGAIPFNEVGSTTLTTTATSIVGAIDEVAAYGWDDIYNNSTTLTIDGSSLTFTQTVTTGAGMVLTRNLAAASTDAAIVEVNNTNASDDQAALYVSNAGSGASILVSQSGTGYGLALDTSPGTFIASIAAANDAGASDSFLLALVEGTLAVPVAGRFIVRVDGHTELKADTSTSPALLITQDSAVTSELLKLQDGNAAVTRWHFYQDGHSDMEVNSTTSGMRIGQQGTGPILELLAGAPLGGTSRLSMTKTGLLTISSDAGVGTEILNLDQNDIDKPFISFDGQESANQTDSISNVDGDGAMVGPHTKSTNPGWDFSRMVQVELNGSTYWLAAYVAVP